jgi:hypothetical protein
MIYGKSKSYPGYRVAWHVACQRKPERFRTNGEAVCRADALVKELAKGSHVTALSAQQTADCMAAVEQLRGLFLQTERKVPVLRAVSECVEAAK